MLRILNLAVYVLKWHGKKTISKPDTKYVFTVLWQVGNNFNWDQGLLSLQLMQWSDASFTGSKHVSNFVTSFPDRDYHSN